MHKFKEEVEQRIYQLKQIIKEKESALKNVPEGTVHVFTSEKRVQFYMKDHDRRRYMKESEKELVKQLCQKDYDQKVLKAAKRELKELKN